MPKEINPERLTIKELKRELEHRGIPLPHSHAKKIEYVNLFKKDLNKQKLLEFSSDEEPTTRITRSYKDPRNTEVRVHLEKLDFSEDMTVDGLDITSLTDVELRSELQKNGINPGPIIASTRRVYENKLVKVLSGAGDSPARIINGIDQYSDQDSASDDEDDVDVEDEPIVVETRKTRRSTTLQYSATKDGSATRRRPMRSEYFDRQEDEKEEEGTVQAETAPAPSTGEKTRTLKSDRKWVPVWVQILIVIALAVFFYIVVQSMESNPHKRISGV